jgi:hypothetical protein
MRSRWVTMRGFVAQPEVLLRLHTVGPPEEFPSKGRAHSAVLVLQLVILVTLALWSWARAAAAEEGDPPGRAAHLGYLQGPVSFQPAGEAEWVEAARNRPLTSGDRLWTGAGARAELSTGPATVRLDASTALGLSNLDDAVLQLRLTYGKITLCLRRLDPGQRVEVDTPTQALSVLEAGRYRVEVAEDGSSTLVTVRAGAGEAWSNGEAHPVHAGQTVRFGATGSSDATATAVAPRPQDDLEAWGALRDRRSAESPSARHVSRGVVGYEDLDDSGTWSKEPGNGDVWFPGAVASAWAPYHDGRWAWIAPWGYTWVDDQAWGYAPSHYGRWTSVHGRWGWVPGPVAVEAVYAPALVAFIHGPGLGLSLSTSEADVGWFALGPHEVFVPGFHASAGYVDRVNLTNTVVSSASVSAAHEAQTDHPNWANTTVYLNQTAFQAVTFVPQLAFANGQPVAQSAVKVPSWRFAVVPVLGNSGVTPTRRAVLGPATAAPQPPAGIAVRAVVTRGPPPPAPLPFDQQRRALEAHPGLPLLREEQDGLRPAVVVAPVPVAVATPPAPSRQKRTQAPGERRPRHARPAALGLAESAVR